jgi:hypothetical protein
MAAVDALVTAVAHSVLAALNTVIAAAVVFAIAATTAVTIPSCCCL